MPAPTGPDPETSYTSLLTSEVGSLDTAVLDLLPAIIFLVSDNFMLQYANRTFSRRFGSMEDCRFCYGLLQARTEPCRACPMQQTLLDRKEHAWIWNDKLRGQVYEIHSTPYIDTTGRVYALGLGLDVTWRGKEHIAHPEPSADSNLIRICCHCKDIHCDNGPWIKIETYLGRKKDMRFSHGICPQCMEKHYPEIE